MSKPANPFDELERLFERMQENFDEAARWWEGEPFDAGRLTGAVKVDLEDRDDELVLTADLPGFDRDDIDVRVADRTLHLSAEREETTEEEREGEYIRRERHEAAVSRSIRLPETVDREDIDASYANGVLTVRMSKSEPLDEGTKIEIE